MMAILKAGDSFLGIHRINSPMSRLRFSVSSALNVLDTNNVDLTTTGGVEFHRNELIFELRRRVDFDKYEYQLSHEMSGKKYKLTMMNHVEELEEPTGKVNLNILKKKFKKRHKIKELLMKFYS